MDTLFNSANQFKCAHNNATFANVKTFKCRLTLYQTFIVTLLSLILNLFIIIPFFF